MTETPLSQMQRADLMTWLGEQGLTLNDLVVGCSRDGADVQPEAFTDEILTQLANDINKAQQANSPKLYADALQRCYADASAENDNPTSPIPSQEQTVNDNELKKMFENITRRLSALEADRAPAAARQFGALSRPAKPKAAITLTPQARQVVEGLKAVAPGVYKRLSALGAA